MIRTSFRFHDFPVHDYVPSIMTHIVIAIDGPAASGKGTLARKLAHRLDFAYLDTGALYRCVGKAVLDAGQDPASETDAVRAARSLSGTLKPEALQDPGLRTDDVGQAASIVAKYPSVRQALFDFQRDFAASPVSERPVKGVILDGRDIGTVICPDAPIKLFVTASVEERARRRHAELTAKGLSATAAEVLADMKRRDERDSTRETAPLTAATDAHIIDTTGLSEADVMERALSIIRGHMVEALARS